MGKGTGTKPDYLSLMPTSSSHGGRREPAPEIANSPVCIDRCTVAYMSIRITHKVNKLNFFLKKKDTSIKVYFGLGVVPHAFNPGTPGAEAGRSLGVPG